jgi:hypothetical protein
VHQIREVLLGFCRFYHGHTRTRYAIERPRPRDMGSAAAGAVRGVCVGSEPPRSGAYAKQEAHLKHEISRLRPVFDGARYVGCLLYTARGWDAYGADDRRLGTFSEDHAAVARLRSLASCST